MRKLASIQRIWKIEPIEGADRIVLAHVLGWQCVVKKGLFQPGDMGVYFEIDSFLPIEPRYEFLRKSCYKETDHMGEGFLIRTQKFRGQISQGLLMPITVFQELSDGIESGTDWPCTEGPFARMFVQIILGFHEDLAPAHRCSHIGLLTGVGDLADRSVDLIPGNDGLLDKERTGTVFYLFQRLLVERGGIRDECDVIIRKRVIVIQVQQLVLKQFFDAGTKRDSQIMAQGVHIEFDAPVLTDMVQIAQVAGPDGTQSDE